MVFRFLLDALFPRRCVSCEAPGWPFCSICLAEMAMLSPPGCRRCGRSLEAAVDRCRDCPPDTIAWARAPLVYAGPVRRALMKLKFGGARAVAQAFAPAMARVLPEGQAQGAPGSGGAVITWVPLGRTRRRRRGFDQAEVLARAVGSLVGLPVGRLLVRPEETSPQARRSGAERRRALRGAFRAVARPPPRVILVDDVLTSGATAAECASVLLRAGAIEVGVLTAARSLGGPLPARCYNPPGLPPGSVVARESVSR